MSDQAPVRTITLGQQAVEVTDPAHLQPVAADVITEVRLVGGVIALSFATYIFDGSGPAEARVCARLRLPLEMAAGVQKTIETLLKDAIKSRDEAN